MDLVTYFLCFCCILPCLRPIDSAPRAGLFGHHDINPDLELSPHRPHRHFHRVTTTQKTYDYKDDIMLPEPPYKPADGDYERTEDYEDEDENDDGAHDYDYNTRDGSSGSIHQHDDDTSTHKEPVFGNTIEENEDELSGSNDLLTDAAAAPNHGYILMMTISMILLL